MENELLRITARARVHPKEKFTSLMRRVFDIERLRESFRAQSGKKAPGIDGVRKEDYERELESNLARLSAGIRQMSYRPKAARRVYIPKLNGGMRPLGIPSFEDRLVQDRMAKVLSAIWEPEFRDSSYGFRPGRGAHDALKAVHRAIMEDGMQHVVEVDIKGYFNSVNHTWLLRCVEERIADPIFKRLIVRFLKAGVMEDGAVAATEEGTPQGGLISPVLSNIYLHYVLDLWFEKCFVKQIRGRACLIRYADDWVACFVEQRDAEHFLVTMTERLRKFSLEIEPSKTKLIPFGSRQIASSDAPTFSFLGITHYVTRSRKGSFKVGRKTEKKRINRGLKQVAQSLAKLRVHGCHRMIEYIRLHLRGHFNYYGVSENSRSLSAYLFHVRRIFYKWLNRRSQKRSCTWAMFAPWWDKLAMPRPRIIHSFYTSPAPMPAGSRMV